MNTFMNMKHRWLKAILAGVAFLLATGASADAAMSLSVGDANYLGLINDGIPANPANEVIYINNLTTLAAGATDTVIGTETYNRVSSTVAGPFPAATDTGAVKDETGSDTINLTGTFTYVLAKYDASAAGSLVWYFAGGVTGEVMVPSTLNGLGVSHITAFNDTDGGGGSGGEVPEPASIALLGLGAVLAGAGLRRRKRLPPELQP